MDQIVDAILTAAQRGYNEYHGYTGEDALFIEPEQAYHHEGNDTLHDHIVMVLGETCQEVEETEAVDEALYQLDWSIAALQTARENVARLQR
jgi:hypothetical protein